MTITTNGAPMRTLSIALRCLPIAAFVGLVVGANWLTASYKPVNWEFGWATLTFTAGTYAAGLVLLARDWVHAKVNVYWVWACIGIGAAISWWWTDSTRLAIASATAFAISETLDLFVYSKLRNKGWAKAAAASNVVGSVIDSLAFLWIANFLTPEVLTGQVVAKILVTLTVIGAVKAVTDA